MDYISYFYYGEGAPEGDLGHGQGMWPNGNLAAGTGKKAFDWAMNGQAVTSSRGKPTFAQVKAGSTPIGRCWWWKTTTPTV